MTIQEIYQKSYIDTIRSRGYTPKTIFKQAAYAGPGSLLGAGIGRFTSLLLGSPAIRNPLRKSIQRHTSKIKELQNTVASLQAAGQDASRQKALIKSLDRRLVREIEPRLASETMKVWGARGLTLGGLGMWHNRNRG